MLKSDKPFFVGRLGSEESRTVQNWIKGRNYSERNYHNILFNARLFLNDKNTLDRFYEVYANNVSDTDLILTWGCVGEAYITKNASEDAVIGRGTFDFMFNDTP